VAHSVDVSTRRDITLDSPIPTIDEQRGFWDWHWENWRERRAISDWVLKRGERVLSSVGSLALDHPQILDLGLGTAGILRLINSPKPNQALNLVIPARYLDTLKERAGFGYSLLVLAQEPF
jgi:hypothetical protein